jgi:hypothetical protein
VNNSKSPTLPFRVWPVATVTLPESPDAVVPLLNTSTPDDPTEIALALRIVTAPLDDTVPDPLTTLTTPPICVGSAVEPPSK